jgi:TonB family protein
VHRIQFIHPPPVNRELQRRVIIISCVLHILMLCGLLGLTLYWRSHLPPPSGSAPGAPTISLQAMVIVSNPPEPPPPSTPTPPPIPIPEVAVATEPLHNPIEPTKVPEMGVAVLPMTPSKPAVAKTEPTHHTTPNHTTTPSAKPAAAAVASSYSPGANVLPHPPYPTEARALGETGTVVMYVEFDAAGNVVSAEITRSSGVPLLDTQTRSFIREHWHSHEFAGQSISQPVQYSLQNL